MAWTATITDIVVTDERTELSIELVSGDIVLTDKISFTQDIGVDGIKQRIKDRVERFEGLKSLTSKLSVGQSITIPSTDSQEQQELTQKMLLAQKIQRYQELKKLVDDGVITATQAKLDDLKLEIKGLI